MSIHDARIAHWRIARNPAGKEIELHPWLPGGVTMLQTATIRHCVGCVTCGDAVEVDPPCDNPRWCSSKRPCEGLRTAQEWARRHAGGTAPAIVTTPETPGKAPVQRRPRWTAEEDAWLLAHAGLSAAEAAGILGRSTGAIEKRRRVLGPTRPCIPWGEHEDRLLRGCTNLRNAMAMLPGRTKTAIKHRAHLIGHSFRKAAAA